MIAPTSRHGDPPPRRPLPPRPLASGEVPLPQMDIAPGEGRDTTPLYLAPRPSRCPGMPTASRRWRSRGRVLREVWERTFGMVHILFKRRQTFSRLSGAPRREPTTVAARSSDRPRGHLGSQENALKKSFVTTTVATAAIAATALATIATSGAQAATQSASGAGLDRAAAAIAAARPTVRPSASTRTRASRPAASPPTRTARRTCASTARSRVCPSSVATSSSTPTRRAPGRA